MKLFLIFNETNDLESIIEKLKKTTDIDGVANVLSGIRNRSIFVRIIDKFLDELSKKNQEVMELKKRLYNMEKKTDIEEEII